ncbi:unnamed protein product [Camellia sinensis]
MKLKMMKSGALELGEASKGSTTPNTGVNRGVSIVDFILRLIAIFATIGSAIAMGTTDETLPFFTRFIRFRAQYDDLPTFTFFVIANSIVSAYLVLSLALSIFHIMRSAAQGTRIVLIFFDSSVKLAVDARDKFWDAKNRISGHGYNRALVAASIGSDGERSSEHEDLLRRSNCFAGTLLDARGGMNRRRYNIVVRLRRRKLRVMKMKKQRKKSNVGSLDCGSFSCSSDRVPRPQGKHKGELVCDLPTIQLLLQANLWIFDRFIRRNCGVYHVDLVVFCSSFSTLIIMSSSSSSSSVQCPCIWNRPYRSSSLHYWFVYFYV